MRKVLQKVLWGALAALFCLLAVDRGVAAAVPPEFETANREYGTGDFKAACDRYEALVKSGPWSANLFYNLGNADYRLGRKGAAFLDYERALALDPAHPEAKVNLNLLRDETGARVQPRPSLIVQAVEWPENLLHRGTPWLIAAAFWGLCFSIAPLFWKRRAAWMPALLSLAVLGWCAAAMISRQSRGPTWIITGKQATARVAPADSSEPAAPSLPMGSHVHLLLDRGEWLYVLLPDQSRGWIARGLLEPVALSRS